MMSAACFPCARRAFPETRSLTYGLVFDAVRWQIVVVAWSRAPAVLSVAAPAKARIITSKPSRLIAHPLRSLSLVNYGGSGRADSGARERGCVGAAETGLGIT
jgi:hypothetical protein